jgi:hypothetical protein
MMEIQIEFDQYFEIMRIHLEMSKLQCYLIEYLLKQIDS